MQGSILVAVGSPQDDEPIAQAHRWAAQTGRRLVACNAVRTPPIQGLLESIDNRTRAALDSACKHAEEHLAERIERVSGRGRDDFELVVMPGSPHAVVLEAADHHHATGIVVGVSDKSLVERTVLGSSAAQIVRHAKVPVLVARASAAGPVIVATDLSDPALNAVEMAVTEAARRSAELVALHCLDLSHRVLGSFEASAIIDETTATAMRDAAHATLRASLERFGAEGRTLIVNGNSVTAITQACRAQDAQLLVVGTHGRSGLSRIALGSVAEAVTRNAPCSVLVVRSQQA